MEDMMKLDNTHLHKLLEGICAQFTMLGTLEWKKIGLHKNNIIRRKDEKKGPNKRYVHQEEQCYQLLSFQNNGLGFFFSINFLVCVA